MFKNLLLCKKTNENCKKFVLFCSHLRNKCFHEKSYRENLLWQARYSGNEHLLSKAQHYPMPACANLEKIYAQAA
jgi:hypothetical protein